MRIIHRFKQSILPLTPAHFLIGQPITILPEADLTCVPENRLCAWRKIMKAKQDFWKRWSVEYLGELQKRQKWTSPGQNVTKDMIVLIKDKNLPCTRWSLARIIELHPGGDGVIRTVTVQTPNAKYKRSVKLLCPLPSN